MEPRHGRASACEPIRHVAAAATATGNIVTGNLAANKSFSAQPITERFALHCAKIPFTTFCILQNTRVLLSHVASVEPPRVTSRSGESGSGRRPIWEHQAVKFDFTADLTGTGNRSEVTK